jgi:Domain of unknown function (DUF397)
MDPIDHAERADLVPVGRQRLGTVPHLHSACRRGGERLQNLDLANSHWTRSSFSSSPDKTCVEVAVTPAGVAVRNSNEPSHFVAFTCAEWEMFLKGVQSGEFNLPG